MKLSEARERGVDVSREIDDVFRVVWRQSGPRAGVSIECADWYADDWPLWPMEAMMLLCAGHAAREDGWTPDRSEPATFCIHHGCWPDAVDE